MDDSLRQIQVEYGVPDFGDVRICYEQLGNDQLMYIDNLPVYAQALGARDPMSDQVLYPAYLHSR